MISGIYQQLMRSLSFGQWIGPLMGLTIGLSIGLTGIPSYAFTADSSLDPSRLPLARDEKINNWAKMYGFQWAVYLVTQNETIRTTGRFQNMLEYPARPQLDNDTFDFNVLKHTLSGQYYFLYYRSNGYTRKEAFLWSAASSLAFEYAIETLTERPSLQDLYQTPVFGTVIGLGVEQISLALLATDSSALHFLGYVLNPFALLPHSAYKVVLAPYWGSSSLGPNNAWGLRVGVSF